MTKNSNTNAFKVAHLVEIFLKFEILECLYNLHCINAIKLYFS